ncbi:MAG: sigma-54-dependent Fis family transcriptional regulator [Deltaproteobacteria bacterium]|nr:sigma-54-dependent Fis family transcriptional regulator [Deltaproteobacteria bacterium]
MPDRILLVDDDPDALDALALSLESVGFEVDRRTSLATGVEALTSGEHALLVTDLDLAGESGLDLAQRAKELRPELPIIVVTGHATVGSAIEAMRAGVWDYLTKPVSADELELQVKRALEHTRLAREVRALRRVAAEQEGLDLLGTSDAVAELRELVQRVAATDVGVLILGESGTGKEVVAQAIHKQSARAAGPFVPVNCAALPETLFESELFGHVRGAFTDARKARRGLFLEADGGTLFLDEIGEMPLAMQPKLLRALQERVVRPVGGDEGLPFDTRVIAATNRDLVEAIAAGTFREDLYYRLNVVQLDLPPLRARGTDVLVLAQTFLDRFAERHKQPVRALSPGAAEQLLRYRWPGNVRELMNAIERAVALSRGEIIEAADLPERVREADEPRMDIAASDVADLVTLAELERRYILRVLEATGGNKTQAARILGVDRKTLLRKLKQKDDGEGEPSEV